MKTDIHPEQKQMLTRATVKQLQTALSDTILLKEKIEEEIKNRETTL